MTYDNIIEPTNRLAENNGKTSVPQIISPIASVEIRKWNLRLASASIVVVIELVKVVPINAPPSSPIECRPLILKCVKVLSRESNNRGCFGTRPKIVNKCRKR